MRSRPWFSVVLQSIVFLAGVGMVIVSIGRVTRPGAGREEWALLVAGAIVALSGATIAGFHLWAWRRERAGLDEVASTSADEDGEPR